MPARRKRRRSKSRNKKPLLKRVSLLAAGLIILIFFLTFKTKFWDGKSKVAVVVNAREDISVLVFDPKIDQIVDIRIPNSTEVEVARQLGVWKIGSVWELGFNEGLQGRLLAETVTKNFMIPVFGWADAKARDFVSGNIKKVISATFAPYKTNIPLSDKIRLGLFSIRVKEFKRVKIYLKDTLFLEKAYLLDGEVGYKITGRMPENLLVVSSDNTLSEKNPKILIVDSTNKRGVAEQLGKIIESTGVKIASVMKEERNDSDCVILTNDTKMVQRLALVFSCSTEKKRPQGNFDIEFRIGQEFAERF
jgi:hypothetical protein